MEGTYRRVDPRERVMRVKSLPTKAKRESCRTPYNEAELPQARYTLQSLEEEMEWVDPSTPSTNQRQILADVRAEAREARVEAHREYTKRVQQAASLEEAQARNRSLAVKCMQAHMTLETMRQKQDTRTTELKRANTVIHTLEKKVAALSTELNVYKEEAKGADVPRSIALDVELRATKTKIKRLETELQACSSTKQICGVECKEARRMIAALEKQITKTKETAKIQLEEAMAKPTQLIAQMEIQANTHAAAEARLERSLTDASTQILEIQEAAQQAQQEQARCIEEANRRSSHLKIALEEAQEARDKATKEAEELTAQREATQAHITCLSEQMNLLRSSHHAVVQELEQTKHTLNELQDQLQSSHHTIGELQDRAMHAEEDANAVHSAHAQLEFTCKSLQVAKDASEQKLLANFDRLAMLEEEAERLRCVTRSKQHVCMADAATEMSVEDPALPLVPPFREGEIQCIGKTLETVTCDLNTMSEELKHRNEELHTSRDTALKKERDMQIAFDEALAAERCARKEELLAARQEITKLTTELERIKTRSRLPVARTSVRPPNTQMKSRLSNSNRVPLAPVSQPSHNFTPHNGQATPPALKIIDPERRRTAHFLMCGASRETNA